MYTHTHTYRRSDAVSSERLTQHRGVWQQVAGSLA
jgi:hypothetical protein